jgi:hypothetical protein
VPVVRVSRGLLVVLALAALVVAAVLQGNPRVDELTLAFAPALILFGLLANGRYVGEDRICARGEQAVLRLRSVLGVHWPPGRDAAFGSLVEHTPLSRRGPPSFSPAS